MDVLDAMESLKPVKSVQKGVNTAAPLVDPTLAEDPGFAAFTTVNGNPFEAVVRNNFVHPLIVSAADMAVLMDAIGGGA